eukprot:CAMPEP_0115847368 /NCGR_PEP_ID=MMETSP0287-20121206/10347_1 /TAXON_ID=412157 /ORGANISM="Chrysochromulina rotalis, Strain UIO044" /LENGTH=183 /DNA_ID=CAMNT_0003301201 /DNA_START=8 /DNA_END=560 /DNA_ORIENTATION=+
MSTPPPPSSTRAPPPPPGHQVPGAVPGGPKPIVYRGMVLNSKLTVFYTLLFVVPSLAAFAWTGGKTQLSREELLASEAAKAKVRERYGPEEEELIKQRKAMMNKVLFETRGTLGKPDWVIKRDEKRARELELKKQQAQQQPSSSNRARSRDLKPLLRCVELPVLPMRPAAPLTILGLSVPPRE